LLGRLRSLGALIAGKTVTEEFAYAGPIPTRNPHHPNHTPGGSSAGSAASVAAGICPLAIGTQTLRSVIGPASFCGVAGFKPSYGRVPLDGVILLSPSFDTIGFFTSDIESMSLAAAHLVPGWQPFRADRKPVLGIPKGAYMSMMFDDVRTMFERQVERLTDAGFAVREVEMPWDDAFVLGDAMLRLVQGEMARVHRDWFAKYSGLYGESVFLAITSGMSITEQELAEYRKGQAVLRTKLSAAAAGGQQSQQIDLWISPSQGGTAPLWGGRTGWSGMTAIWSYAGLPQLTIPAAKLNGLSVGFQCIGRYGEDEAALCWGEQIAAAVREIAQPNDPVA
jgi:Asp-tRNA(Asn)/Glu-tRNA(Gln) amidotransferase A subunit family amidase